MRVLGLDGNTAKSCRRLTTSSTDGRLGIASGRKRKKCCRDICAQPMRWLGLRTVGPLGAGFAPSYDVPQLVIIIGP